MNFELKDRKMGHLHVCKFVSFLIVGKSSLLYEMFICLIPCELLFCSITINGRDVVIMFHERFLRQKVTYVVAMHE